MNDETQASSHSSFITPRSSLHIMSTEKSEKELAYLHELYVATDWGERFAELIDEHVKLPAEGRALYVASGTGAHALALVNRAARDVTLVCVDEGGGGLEVGPPGAPGVQRG